MINKVRKTIEINNLIPAGGHVVLGLSGGPDSMCMFHVLYKLSKEGYGFTIHPVHVNHKFRPVAAENDQAFVERTCEEYGLNCHSFVFDCNKIAREENMTSEEAGRAARYRAFDEIALGLVEQGIEKENIVIAVAQNSWDQCETILFRIMRGTGVDGLAAMSYSRLNQNGIRVVRPILDIGREEIEAYCAKEGLNPRIDHTNNEAIYTRNKIRLELIPYLKENFNENIIDTINRLGKNASTDKEYIWQEAEKRFTELVSVDGEEKQCQMFIEQIKNLHQALRIRVYNLSINKLGIKENISSAHLGAIDQLLTSQNPSGLVYLPEGLMAWRRYDRLVIGKRGEAKSYMDAQNWRISKMSIKEYLSYLEEKEASNVSEASEAPNMSMVSEGTTAPNMSEASEAPNVSEASGAPNMSMVSEGTTAPKVSETSEAPNVSEASEASKASSIFAAFLIDDDSMQIELRTRRDGDYIPIVIDREKKTYGRKKLQDILVDNKLPKEYRDNVLLLTLGNQVLWILPTEMSRGRVNPLYVLPKNPAEIRERLCEESWINGERPSGNGERPSGNGERPSGNGERPSGNDERPGGNGERPSGNGERPSGNGERPSGNGEKPCPSKTLNDGDKAVIILEYLLNLW